MIEERLLILLRSRAGARGVVPINESTLVSESGVPQADVRTAIDKLARAGLLDILAPLPFLVVRLRSWSGSGQKLGNSDASAYSYSSGFHNRLKDSYSHPEQTLMREILDTLGESDPASFDGAIKSYSPEVIRKALDRVRRARSVRKNRTALFRYLLTKLA